MNAILTWINDRTGIRDAWRAFTDAPLAGGACWLRTLPAAIFLTFCVQAITGFFLWMYYSPSTQTAWESVYYLQYQVLGGWLLRAAHHFAGQATLVLAGLYLLALIFSGRYRAPRETVYWIALLMVLCSLALLLTGDLLAWSQNGYAGTKVRASFSMLLPGIGEEAYKLLIGGPAFGHLTLTRFLALHIGLFGGGFALMLVLHFVFARRANRTLVLEVKKTAPFWPDQAARNAVVFFIVLAAISGLSLWHGCREADLHRGVALGSPADPAPTNSFDAARPEWAFRGLYQFSHYFPGDKAIYAIFVVPGAILLLFFLLPFLGRWRPVDYLNRAGTSALLIALVGLSYLSYSQDADDPKHRNVLAEEQLRADRAIALARAKGIPATGALTLLQNDALAEGRLLFRQNCASCHNATDKDGLDIAAEKPSAPDLHGFASREWIKGLLDPKQIMTPKYFGGTKIRGGMIDFVRKTLPDLLQDENGKQSLEAEKNLAKVVMAVSAEAQLPSQCDLDNRDKKLIEEGRVLLVDDFGCTDCHKFRGQGKLGMAPDLTGYGSKAWIAAFTSDPKSKRFYGQKNDRMPSYAESVDPSRNLLSPHSLEMLADWLRGDWFKE
ncbi:MAG: cytochrome b N-terminal domain-containing protein [Pirellulales bacterium]|nr:cytochrome b N-terminal domain-containing protein [Pirellulales bacterium]